MTIKYLSSILLIIFFFNCNAQGLISNAKTDSDYKKIAPKHSFFSNDAEGLPKKIDLSVYLPSVINQEKWGTCVGISSAYYMRTILEARRLGITDSKKINEISFSPSYLYNAIKDSSNTECYNGTELVKALDFLKNKGIAQLKEQPYPYCGNNIDSIKLRDNSKIMDYIRLFGLTDKEVNVVEAAKKALSEYTPLLVGILTTQSLQKLHFTSTFWARIKHFFGFSLSESEDFRLWKPNKSVSFRGDHAICIVGYDDNKYGGAFQAVNSWGPWWGENGLFWIKYTDFPKVAKYCFQAYLSNKVDAKSVEMAANIQLHFGSFSTGNDVPFERTKFKNKADTTNQLVAYNLVLPQEDKTKYYFEANVEKQTYLYLIGKNEEVKEIQLLFPNADSTSELLGPNTKFLLPSPQWNSQTNLWEEMQYQLEPPTGLEYWLFLFSPTKLNISEYIEKLSVAKGNFPEKIISTFGNNLIPFNQIKYNDKKVGFTVNGNHQGQIVPILISFEHIKDNKQGFLAF